MSSLDRQSLRIVRAIVAAALLCVVAGTAAQEEVYREVDAAGQVTYTDRPSADPARRKSTAHATTVANALANNVAISSRFATSVNAKEAARRLQHAQFKQRQGMQLLPGERMVNAGAGEPPNRYWRRQERLRIAVEHAQRRVDETRQPALAQR